MPAAPACEEAALPAAIAALADRSKEIVAITVDERNSRVDLARALMKQYGMNALVVTSGASLRYYTGADWAQTERLFAYVVPQAAAPFVVCPFFERERLGDVLMQFPERETTLSYLWQESEDPYIILRRALGESNVTAGVLGLEEQMPYGMANMIAMACPALKMVPATPVTAGQRTLKSATELALMQLASKITFDVFKAAYLSCGPGDTTAKFVSLVEKGFAHCGVEGEATVNVGIASSLPYGSPKPQVMHEREMVMVSGGCTIDGYRAEIARSFVYGIPSDYQRTVFETARNAQSAALAAARPEVAMQVVDAAARTVVGQGGYGGGYETFTHRVGQGIGLDGHEWPYLVGGNPQKLVAGMAFAVAPGIYLPGKFGVRVADTMVITEKGAELLTWQSPSLQDPFAIPADLPVSADEAAPVDGAKPGDAAKAADSAKPAEAPKVDAAPVQPKPDEVPAAKP